MRRRPPVWAAPAAVTAFAMIATPLRPRGGPGRRVLASVVVGALAATTWARAASRWTPRQVVAGAAAVVVGTAAVERIGTTTGLPFGRYGYTGALRPEVGGVPVIVPLAWSAMALPAREVAHAIAGPRSSAPVRVVLGAAALTAWDLFLDPQMVGEGYWSWARAGRYRGIPASNFVGWFVTGLGVMAALEALLPPADEPDPVLVGEYAGMAVMETVGFGVFFRDRVVAAVGGVGMLAPALAALARWRGRR